MSDFIDRTNMYIVFMIYIVYILKKAEREREREKTFCRMLQRKIAISEKYEGF